MRGRERELKRNNFYMLESPTQQLSPEQQPPREQRSENREMVLKLKDLLNNVSERAEERQEFLSAIDELNSLDKLVADNSKITPETAEIFEERTREIGKKFEQLKNFQISPSEKLRLARADAMHSQIGQIIIDKNNYASETISHVSDTRNDILIKLSSVFTNGQIIWTEADRKELGELQFKNAKTKVEKERLRYLTEKGAKLTKEFEEWANFPYSTYEPYCPEKEIKKIRALSEEEQNLPQKELRIKLKQVRLDEFKQKLAKQKEGLAGLQIEFLETVNANPDFKIEDLMTLVDKAAPEYQLNPRQVKFFRDLAEEYKKRHEAIKQIREKYPDNIDGDKCLFNDLFHSQPVGSIEVLTGPLTLYFMCHDKKDYSVIYQQKSVETLTQEDIDIADKSGGVKIHYSEKNELRHAITAENSHYYRGSATGYSEATMRHEEQHALNSLVADQLFEKAFQHSIESAETPEKLKQEVITYLRSKREYLNFRLKDEVLAYYKEKEYPMDDNSGNPRFIKIFKILTKPHEHKGLYDYYRNPDYADYRQLGYFSEVSMLEELATKGMSKEEVDEIKNNLFSNTVYHGKVLNYLHTIKDLEKKGYAQNEIIYLLTLEHPENWQRTASIMPKKI